ncbi:MAG: hypothetical protein ACXAEX_00750 [Promethearchaeota archaeon]|jgi:hypothetical protein
MNLKNWKQKGFILAIFGCVQALILTTIAMFFYSGGTFNDPNTRGYLFWSNLFSDLGRLTAHSGESNLVSSLIYNISLFLMGVLLVFYFTGMLLSFNEVELGKKYIYAGSVIGIPISLSFIGASLTPADLFYGIHVSFGIFVFTFTLPLIILYTFGIYINKDYPNFYAFIYVALGIILFIFLLIMSLGFTEEGVEAFFAAGQNIVVIALTTCFAIQAYGAWKTNKIIT